MKEVMGHCAHAASPDSMGLAGHRFGGTRTVGYPRAVLVGASTWRGRAPVAQRIEHLTTDQKVWGSNPYGRATCSRRGCRGSFAVQGREPRSLSATIRSEPRSSPRRRAGRPRRCRGRSPGAGRSSPGCSRGRPGRRPRSASARSRPGLAPWLARRTRARRPGDTFGAVRRHELLRQLHQRLAPRRYLEIGVSTGASLALSRARSIGVDPFFRVKHGLHCDLQLVRETSDEFFASEGAFDHFGGEPFDLAFIDGMHLSEYALRDFINTERHSHPASVIMLDDMLPRVVVEGGRDRRDARAHGAWAGDVYKVVGSLRALRPDLVCLEMD